MSGPSIVRFGDVLPLRRRDPVHFAPEKFFGELLIKSNDVAVPSLG